MARTTLPRVPDRPHPVVGPIPGPVPGATSGPFAYRRPLLRLLAVSAVALATANCSTNPQKLAAGPAGNGLDPKYGVKASPRLYNEGDAIPKGGGRRFSGKPYVVAGRTYVPREDARGYVREGEASWYGSAFHGRMTANGEVFDRHAIVAAHPTLPLPSYARVTNTTNGYSMVVRVNDRGPYHANRVMDVSEEVAHALAFHNRGTTRVRVEYIGKASVAGSDDRKLMATLRTDGRPGGSRSPVMLADLGPSEEAPERFAKPARAPLAFRPEAAPDTAPEIDEAPRPARPPVMLARAAVSVPPALQPTAPRAGAFRPSAVAALDPADASRATHRSIAGTRVADTRVADRSADKGADKAANRGAPAAIPVSGRLAMARLATVQPAGQAPRYAAAPKVAADAHRGVVPTGKPPVQAAKPVTKTAVQATKTAVPATRTAVQATNPATQGARIATAPAQKGAPPRRGDRLAGIY